MNFIDLLETAYCSLSVVNPTYIFFPGDAYKSPDQMPNV